MLSVRSMFPKAGVAAAISLAVFTFVQDVAAAKVDLPTCPSHKHVVWTNCRGAITSGDGEKYVGEFKYDMKNGQGTSTWPNGEKYVGKYEDHSRNGQGTYTWPNGAKYVGEFRNNMPTRGTYTWPSGEKYVGEFKDGKFWGEGTLYAADGSIKQSGIWAAGDLVKRSSASKSVYEKVLSAVSGGSESAKDSLPLILVLVAGIGIAAFSLMNAKHQRSVAASFKAEGSAIIAQPTDGKSPVPTASEETPSKGKLSQSESEPITVIDKAAVSRTSPASEEAIHEVDATHSATEAKLQAYIAEAAEADGAAVVEQPVNGESLIPTASRESPLKAEFPQSESERSAVTTVAAYSRTPSVTEEATHEIAEPHHATGVEPIRAVEVVDLPASTEQKVEQPKGKASASPAANVNLDFVAELERLARLRDAGALTDAEFQAEKSKILNG